MNNIEVKNLCKSFDKKAVIDDFSVTIEVGKTTCIMGASGCGKTTFARILSGLENQDSGVIINVPNSISFVFQENRLSENYSPISNIEFVTGKAVSKESITEMLGSLGLKDALNKPVSTMSGGMKRRVAIARALAVPYELLIMDEPFKGLDEELKFSVMSYVKEKTKGKTVICITHEASEAEFFGDKIINFPKTK